MERFGTGLIVRDVNGNTLAKVPDLGVTVDPLTRTTIDPVTGCGVRVSDNGEWVVLTVALADDGGGIMTVPEPWEPGPLLGIIPASGYDRERVYVFASLCHGRGDFTDPLNAADRTVETIDHETIRYGDVPNVTVTWSYGTARELRRGDGSGGAGIDPATVAMLPAEDRARVDRIVTLADRWHLNTMRAGCAHNGPAVYREGRYGRELDLDAIDPCPLTGYRYGSAWLVEVPPVEVLRELRELLPA